MARMLLLALALVAVVIAAVVGVAAAQPPSNTDGWVVAGPERTCADFGVSASACETLVGVAIEGMPRATGATLLSRSFYAVGAYVANGKEHLGAFSSHSVMGLVVARFSDGSVHARMFGCAGVSPPNMAPPCPAGSPITHGTAPTE